MWNQGEIIAGCLGLYLDGWGDLIEGMSSKASQVRESVIEQLKSRQMPEIEIKEHIPIKAGFFNNERRDYTITTTAPGVTTTIYISNHGTDLFTSWRCFIRPTFNWRLLGFFAIIAVVISAVISGITSIKVMYEVINLVFHYKDWTDLKIAFGYWIFGGMLVFSLECLVFLAIKLLRKNLQETKFSIKIILSMIAFALLSVLPFKDIANNLVSGLNEMKGLYTQYMQFVSLPGLVAISTAWTIFVSLIVLTILLGLFLKRDVFAFILDEGNLLDAEDIMAMNLSVHKSLIRALDSVGIESSKLRLKDTFVSRRNEKI